MMSRRKAIFWITRTLILGLLLVFSATHFAEAKNIIYAVPLGSGQVAEHRAPNRTTVKGTASLLDQVGSFFKNLFSRPAQPPLPSKSVIVAQPEFKKIISTQPTTQALIQPIIRTEPVREILREVQIEKVVIDDTNFKAFLDEYEAYKKNQQRLIAEMSQVTNVGPRGNVAYTIGNPTFTGTAQGLADDDIPNDITIGSSGDGSFAGNLTVGGDLTVSGNQNIPNLSVTDKLRIGTDSITIDGTNNYISSPSNALSIYTTSTPLAISAFTASSTFSSYVNGNFGIGTTTPGAGLSVGSGTTTILGGDLYVYRQANIRNLVSTTTNASGFGTTSPGLVLEVGGFGVVKGNWNIEATSTASSFHATSTLSVASSSPTSPFAVVGRSVFGGDVVVTGDVKAGGNLKVGGVVIDQSGQISGIGSLTANVGVSSSTPGAALGVKGAGIFDGFVSASYFTATSSNDSWILGDLGIGTTSPGLKLEVAGFGVVKGNWNVEATSTVSSLIATSTLEVRGALTGGVPDLVVQEGSVAVGSSTPYGQFSVEATAGTVNANTPIFVIGDQGTSSPLFYVSGNDGAIGIGTAALVSGSKLTIRNTTSTGVLALAGSPGFSTVGPGFSMTSPTSGGSYEVGLSDTGIPGFIITGNQRIQLETTVADGAIRFKRGGTFQLVLRDTDTTINLDGSIDTIIAASGAANAFFVNGTTGNVGIGQKSANVALDVIGTTTVSSGIEILGKQLFIGNGLIATSSIYGQYGNLGFASSVPYGQVSIEAQQGIVGSTTPIFVIGDQGTSSPLFEIDSTGRVGIATSTIGTNPAIQGLGLSVATSTYIQGGLGVGAATTSAGGLFVKGSADIYDGLIVRGGKVGVGTTSPNALFALGTGNILLTPAAGNANGGILWANDGEWQMQSDQSSYIRFITNNIEVLRMDSSGNVGIGTLDPSTLLEVAGAARTGTTTATGIEIVGRQLYIGNGITATSSIFGQYGNLGFGTATPFGQVSIEAVQGQVGSSTPIFVIGDQGTSSPLLYVSGNNGDVGIGITNPTNRLSVTDSDSSTSFGDTNTQIPLEIRNTNTTANNFANIVFRSGSNATGAAVIGAQFVNHSSVTGNLLFGTTNSGSFSEKMRIASAGYVGIGTTNPGTVNGTSFTSIPLHVAGGGKYLAIDSTSGGTGGLLINDASEAANSRLWGLTVNNAAAGLAIETFTDAGINTPIVVFDRSGNVGIARSGPSTALEVVGTTTTSGLAILNRQLYIGNGITATSSIFGQYGNLGFASTVPYGQFSIEADEDVVGSTTPIFVIGDQGTGTPIFYVSGNNGNVGIGTAAPEGKLDVTETSAGTTNTILFAHDDDTNAASHIRNVIRAGGTSGGDAFTLYQISGGANWSVGIDNSDSDSFKLSGSTQPGTTDFVTITTAGNIGIATGTLGHRLEVAGFGVVKGNWNVEATSTASSFNATSTLSVGTSTPGTNTQLSVSGNSYISGGLGVGVATTSAGGLFVKGSADIYDGLIVRGGKLSVGTTTNALTAARLVVANSLGGFGPTLELRSFGQTSGDGPALVLTDPSGEIDFQLFTDSANEYTRVKSLGQLALHAGSTDISGTNEFVTIRTEGDVGIGSTTPGGQTRLSVAGNGVFKGNLNVEATSTVSSLIATSTLSVGTSTPGTNTQLSVSGNSYISGGLGVGVATTSAGGLFVKGSADIYDGLIVRGGRVGIGTTSPNALFALGTGNILLTPAAGNANGGILWANDGEWQMQSDQSSYIRFITNNIEALRMDSSGNVGIGTTSPATTLSVAGNALITGTTTVQEIKFMESDIASSTPNRNTLYANNIVKGWILFESVSATPTILNSFNVTSITDGGVGTITINWSQGFATAYHADVSTCGADNVNDFVTYDNIAGTLRGGNLTTTSTKLVCVNRADGTATDPYAWSVISIGTQ